MFRVIGRYLVRGKLASGGMAEVHLGELSAAFGFSKVVAIKTMHTQFASDPEFRAMFLDEARLVARIRHRSVVSTLDILEESGELALVMDYVHGPNLMRLLRRANANGDVGLPLAIVGALVVDILGGLHAAHEATASDGTPLQVVHRDISPDNVLLGDDGTARVTDFGIASAVDRLYLTRPGEVKGKAAYMSPEQVKGEGIDRRADVYSCGVLMFELLTGVKPFPGQGFADVALRRLTEPPPLPSIYRSDIPPDVDSVILRALSRARDERFASAQEMCEAVASVVPRASSEEVAAWLRQSDPEFFSERDSLLRARSTTVPPRRPYDPEVPNAFATTRAAQQSLPKFRLPRRGAIALGSVITAACLLAVAAVGIAASAPGETRPPSIHTFQGRASAEPIMFARAEDSLLPSDKPTIVPRSTPEGARRSAAPEAATQAGAPVPVSPLAPACCNANNDWTGFRPPKCRANCKESAGYPREILSP